MNRSLPYNAIFSRTNTILSMVFVLSMSVLLNACSDTTYTFRCECNKVAYDASGGVLKDDSFHQVVCDTTENIESTFDGELSDLAQDCAQYFNGVENIAETDCTCTCDLIGDCQ